MEAEQSPSELVFLIVGSFIDLFFVFAQAVGRYIGGSFQKSGALTRTPSRGTLTIRTPKKKDPQFIQTAR